MSTVTDAKSWKKKGGVGTFEVEVPSGNVCKARRATLSTFITQGLVPNSLMSIMTEAMGKGQQTQEKSASDVMKEIAANPQMAADMFKLVDAVTVYCVIEPKVHAVPEGDGERSENELYVDEIDEADKMFLFQWATGGTSDLETFREQQGQQLESVPAKPVAKHPTKRTTRPKKR